MTSSFFVPFSLPPLGPVGIGLYSTSAPTPVKGKIVARSENREKNDPRQLYYAWVHVMNSFSTHHLTLVS